MISCIESKIGGINLLLKIIELVLNQRLFKNEGVPYLNTRKPTKLGLKLETLTFILGA